MSEEIQTRRRAGLKALVDFYENLGPERLGELPRFYTSQARFHDPFNDVRGPEAIGAVFAHMFENLERPRFQVLSQMLDGNHACVEWILHASLRRRALRVRGVSLLVLDEQGRVCLHRDYWDPAKGLLSRLPIIGPLVRALWQRFSASATA